MCVSGCKFWVEDADEQKCVSTCQKSAKYHDKSGKCVSSCPQKADKDGLCVDGDDRGNKGWLIPTIVVSAVVVVCAIGAVIWVMCKKR